MKMIKDAYRFVRMFFMYLRDYKMYKLFVSEKLTPEQREECRKADKEKGIEPHDGNAFNYALHLSRIWWEHRDRYSDRCTGECDNCNAKHC